MVFFNLLKVAKMLVRLLSAVQMWDWKTPISVLNCLGLLSKHFLSSGRRCCLAISAAQMIEVCRTALFRAKELDSTLSRDELRRSKHGLKRPREPTASTSSHDASSCDPVITAHLCVGLSHV